MRCKSTSTINSMLAYFEEHLVDMIISDAQYLPLRKADQPGPDPALESWLRLVNLRPAPLT